MATRRELKIERGLGALILDKESDPDLLADDIGSEDETARATEAEGQGAGTDVQAAELETPDGDVSPEVAQAANITIEDLEIFVSFVHESQDHLSNIEKKILTLEESQDRDVVDEIFRSMHTIKGTSSFFGLEKIKSLSHSLESLLDGLRADRVAVTTEFIDVLLAGTDLLVRMIDDLGDKVGGLDPAASPVEIAQAPGDILGIIERIRSFERLPESTATQTEEPVPGEESSTPAGPVESPPDLGESLITPELVASFTTEARDLLDQAERDILTLEQAPEEIGQIDGAFRAVHTLKGNAGFLGFAEIEEMCMELEGNLDAIRTGTKEVRPKTITILLNTVDSMSRMINELADSSRDDAPARPLGEILIDLGETSPESIDEALGKQDAPGLEGMKLGEILLAEGSVSESGLERALSAQKTTKQVPAQSTGPDRKDIRVDMAKLDKMFDLMGELITAEAMVIHNPEVQGIESFNTAAVYLNKITREMQEITMSVRMIPLDGLFNKMNRLVRDLSRRFGKKVDLSISGQDTEMDRNIIEQISDPLIHIIRNSIDHGIETVEERRAAGKPDTGRISLSAKYEGNEIWITVEDDGRGLNRDRIINKAREKGLIKPDAELQSDDDVWQLLFQPGFSTAEKVSEISGRGVGMDVVKRNIESLRGKIALDTELGQGTELVIKIPLTLAIIDGITFTVGDVLYALPLGDILEFYKASASDVTETGPGSEVLKLRDRIMPVIKLFEFYGTRTEKTRVEDGIIIVVQANGRSAALLADGIAGYHQIVVKALPEYLGEMRAISGCSIMGNGEVSLIVDTGSLLRTELE